MDAANRAALKLDIEQDAVTGAADVFSKEVLQHQLNTNLSVTGSISKDDVTVSDQLTKNSSLSFTVGKDHAMLNYKLTF